MATRSPDRTITYDPNLPTGVIDVWDPVTPARAVTVALVHGGFWKAEWDRHHLDPLATALAEDGYAVASVEYPRVGMPGGGYPGTAWAVQVALGAVCADAGLPSTVVAVGHSAGGHLAVWSASGRPGDVPGLDLAGVVSLAGVLDLSLARRLHLGSGAVDAFLADCPAAAQPSADPAELRLLAPTLLVTGDQDEDVPHTISQSYLARRPSDGAPAELRLLPGVGHMDLIDPGHPAYGDLLRAVSDLTTLPDDRDRSGS